MLKPVCIVGMLLFAGCFCAQAQKPDSGFLNKAVSSLQQQADALPAEKVYLHLARSFYTPGDTIWFKAYTVVGTHHQLSALSGVLYAELINSKDSVVKRLNLRLTAGVAWGNFNLSRSIKRGMYRIRAYTKWMRNQGPDYFYNVYFSIGGDEASTKRVTAIIQKRPDVQFFPEGGNLVAGLRSRVAFKATDFNGLGVKVKGRVIDNDGKAVAFFDTQHNGMGAFALTPQAGKTYQAVCTYSDSSKTTTALPKALDEGFTLTLNNASPDSILVKIAANADLFAKMANHNCYVIAQSNGKVYYTAEAKLESAGFIAKIDKRLFPSGITTFTLFTDAGEPVNERIVFIASKDTLDIKAAPFAETYQPRQKVNIALTAQNGEGQAIAGAFSAAVINESRTPYDEDAESTIMTTLLLTSDIKGYIEKPNYYFKTNAEQTRADLDLLMLTQGYRRFVWKQVLENKAPNIVYHPEKDLELAGVLKTPGGKPVPNGRLSLLSTKENFMADTVTDINGNFRLTDLELSDSAKVVLRARKSNNGSNVAIYVQKPNYPDVKITAEQRASGAGGTKSAIDSNTLAIYREQLYADSIKKGLLKEVKINAKKKSAVPDKFSGYGTALEYNVDLSKLDNSSTLNNALRHAVPGLFYERGRLRYDGAAIGVVINGNDFFNQASLVSFGVSEVQSITLVANNQAPIVYIVTKKYAGTDTTRLKEVVIKSKKSTAPDMSHSANFRGGGSADQVLMGDKLENKGCINLSDCLRSLIFGVNFVSGIAYNTRAVDLGGQKQMSIILDGNTMDASALDNIPAEDIYSIEVLRSAAARSIYGTSIQGGGALVITTKRGAGISYATSEEPSGLITYPYKGYAKARQFYSPKYNKPNAPAGMPDMRTTIFWKPDMVTGADGKTAFEFFNADTKGTYRVVIEGIDDSGNIGRRVYRYTVE
jgi:hypothetical protein